MEKQIPKKKKDIQYPAIFRWCIAILIIGMAISYTIATVLGFVANERRIDLTNLAVIAFAIIVALLLIYPDFLGRLKIFQVSSFKIEMLEQVKEKQVEQEARLKDIALILPLLLPKAQQLHLLNIANGLTSDYVGSHSTRSELRNLRSAGLIESQPNTHIAQLKDDTKLDIAMLVQLTPLGNRWVDRIKEVEQADKE
jgi:hypothetical protein